MRILADFHHSDLWWSHHLIFEKALGHELFRPRGMDWFDHGYYRHATRDVASQFLEGSLFPLEEVVKYPSCRRKIPAGTPAGTMASMDTLNGCLDYPLIRTLTIDPNRRYHGTGRPPGGPRRPYGPRKKQQPEPS